MNMLPENINKSIVELMFMTIAAGKRAMAKDEGGFKKIGQARCLEIIADKGAIDQRELLWHMYMRPASLSELLAKLERNSFIARRQSADDRRNKIVQITPEGIEESKRNIILRDKIFNQRMSVLSEDEKEQLYALLLKLYTAWGGQNRDSERSCL